MFGKKKMNAQMLTDITRGIHHAVNTTGSMISQQYLMLFQQFFDNEADGSMKAKMVKVAMDEQHDILVPLIALVQPQGIALDKMRFELSIQITESELKKATHDVDGMNAERAAFKVYLSPKTGEGSRRRSDIVDVEMTFTRCEPPEGMSRLIENYANMVQPFKSEDEAPPEEPPTNGDDTDGDGAPRGPLGAAGFSSSPAQKSRRNLNIVNLDTKASSNLPGEDSEIKDD